jgi:hypothetical protein
MHDQPSEKRWALRLILVGLGSTSSAIGIIGLKNGILWIPKLSQRFGTVTFTPTAMLLAFGLIFVLIGVIPWGKRERDTNHKQRK